MLKNQSKLNASGAVAMADGPPRVRAGADEMLRELSSLGLTKEASVGILMVLMRPEAPTPALDPYEW